MRTILLCLCFSCAWGLRPLAAEESLLIKTLKGASGMIYSSAVSADGRYVAAGGVDKTINVWRLEDSSLLKSLKGHKSFINSVAFSPDGGLLASAGEDGVVKLWNLADGSCVSTLQGHRESATAVAFFPDGRRFASAGGDGTVKIWDVKARTPRRTLKTRAGYAYAVAVSSDGKRIASGNANTTVTLWNAESGAFEIAFEGHRDAVNSVAFSAAGNYLASGSEDGSVKIWRISDGLCVKTFEGQRRPVLSVSYSPDGQYVFSGGKDRAVSAWPVSDGGQPRTFLGHSGPVKSVSFTADGKYLLSGSQDRTIKLWLTPWEADRRDAEIKKAADLEAEKNKNYDTHYAAGLNLLASSDIENLKGAITEFTLALTYKQEKAGEAKLKEAVEALRLAEERKKNRLILSLAGAAAALLAMAGFVIVTKVRYKIKLRKTLPGEIKVETLSGNYENALSRYEQYKAAGGKPQALPREEMLELYRGLHTLDALCKEDLPCGYLLFYAAAIAKEGNYKLALSMLRSGKLADDFKEAGEYDAFADVYEKTDRPESLLAVKLSPAAYSGLAEAFFRLGDYEACEKVCALKKQFHPGKLTPRDAELPAACQKAAAGKKTPAA
ncbi:MAG: hypothetical protein A2X35_03390 [Elusimicrobia bacterium GWA2_61_42]|nr:MAG: hypothetical protein A2X35_03390 [Elusimicrobia bacterium GWA2_61_42]OGR77629.1 MAG: hypothetical protein A2X38_09630 [Elusimicrobia bacterium GWC2_61_25]